MNQKSTFSPTDTAVLAAFCMFLSVIEYMIPKPLPFLRLGLAHLPILMSLMIFTPKQTLLLTLLKILGQGMVNGSLFSYIFLFSASGSITSTLIMLIVYRLFSKQVSLIGVSIAGATASNLVQIILARQFIFGKAAVLIAPVFLTIGVISSIALGLFASSFVGQSEWISLRIKAAESSERKDPEPKIEEKNLKASRFARFTLICGLVSIPAFVFQQNTLLLAIEAAIFIIFSAIRGKKFKPLPNIIMAAGIIAANLFTPFGRVLLEVGSIRITSGALESGVSKAAMIIGLIYISRVSVIKGLRLPGRLGSLLALVFYFFERFTEGRRIKRKNIIKQLDDRLIDLTVYDEGKNKGSETAQSSPKSIDFIRSILQPLIAWAALITPKLLS